MKMMPPKDPNDRVDYFWDWSAWLPEGDSVATSQIIPDDAEALTIDGTQQSATAISCFVAGGSLHQKHIITNRIVTAQGRQKDASIIIPIEQN